MYPGESKRGAELAGFTEGVNYAQRNPVTLYQARARARMEQDEKVTLHFTRTFALGRGHKAERYDSSDAAAAAFQLTAHLAGSCRYLCWQRPIIEVCTVDHVPGAKAYAQQRSQGSSTIGLIPMLSVLLLEPDGHQVR